jgi:hypothetical protein
MAAEFCIYEIDELEAEFEIRLASDLMHSQGRMDELESFSPSIVTRVLERLVYLRREERVELQRVRQLARELDEKEALQIAQDAEFARQLANQDFEAHLTPVTIEDISLLKAIKEAKEKSFESQENCSICLEEVDEKNCFCIRELVNENDGCSQHFFHQECIRSWMKNGNQKCPICRKGKDWRNASERLAEFAHQFE